MTLHPLPSLMLLDRPLVSPALAHCRRLAARAYPSHVWAHPDAERDFHALLDKVRDHLLAGGSEDLAQARATVAVLFACEAVRARMLVADERSPVLADLRELHALLIAA